MFKISSISTLNIYPDGIMSAEGLLDNPALFLPATFGMGGGKICNVNKLDLAMEYLDLVDQYPVKMKCLIFHIRRMCKHELIGLALNYILIE